MTLENQDTIIFENTIESLGLCKSCKLPHSQTSKHIGYNHYSRRFRHYLRHSSRLTIFTASYCIHYTLATPSKLTELKRISYRRTKDININHLKTKINQALPTNHDYNSSDNIVHKYNKALTEVMDKLAPVKTKTVSNIPKLPWFHNNLACEIRKRKWLEKIWHKDRTNISNYHLFYTQCHRVSNILSFVKKDFYKHH